MRMTSFCAKCEVVEVGPALVQRQVQGVVRVVVEVRPGRDDPVDEPGLDQRDQAAHAQPGGRQGARERQPDRAIGLEHLAGEDLADLAEPARVVAQEGLVDQVGGGLAARHGRGRDPMLADAFEEGHGGPRRYARSVLGSRPAEETIMARGWPPPPRWSRARPCGRRPSG